MWTDTHCHLDAPEFNPDRDAVVARARAAGVAQIVIPAVMPANFAAVRDLAHRHGCAYALGIHPLCVDAASPADLDAVQSALERHRDDPRLVAVGEIGLDHFVPGLDRAKQQHFYAVQLGFARDAGLPVILHARRSADLLLKYLRRTPVRGGIAHAFNGSRQQADGFTELGLRLGFGGAMTFDRALQIRRLAGSLPEESIVLETDAPDIPPHWLYRTAIDRALDQAESHRVLDQAESHRVLDAVVTDRPLESAAAGPAAGASSRNESAELPRIAETLAELRGCSLAEVARFTSANARAALPKLVALDGQER